MSEFVLAFGVFQIWMYGFLTTLFSHSFWWGYAIVLIVVHAFLFTADHSGGDPPTLLVLQVWWTFTYPFGALVALIAVSRFNLPVLIDVSELNEKRRWTWASIGTYLFVWAWLFFFAGINFVLLRFTKTGISPIGDFSDSLSRGLGVFLLALVAILVIVLTVLMARGSDIAKRNVKYLWLLAFLSWTGYVHDTLEARGIVKRPGPGGIMLAVLIALILLSAPLFYYIPSSRRLDPYHRNWRSTWLFLLVLAALLVPALVVGWIAKNASQGDHVAVFVALVVYSVVAVGIVVGVSILFSARGNGIAATTRDARAVRVRRKRVTRMPRLPRATVDR